MSVQVVVCFGNRRDAADEIEREAADQSGVVGWHGGCDIFVPQSGVDVVVDAELNRRPRRQQVVGSSKERQSQQAARAAGRGLLIGVFLLRGAGKAVGRRRWRVGQNTINYAVAARDCKREWN